MPSFGRRHDVPGGRRQEKRQRVVLMGSAVTLAGSRSVLLDDICPTGAKLRGRQLPSLGEQVLVKIGSRDVLASVVWHRRGECGINFDTPLDSNGVQYLKTEGAVGRVLGVI